MLSNKKIIELFNRLKSRKNAWLDSKTDNRTFFNADYDPDFNLEEVKELLNEDKEAIDVN